MAPPVQAAIEGTGEIGLAVMATTLSLLAVFLPVGFMGGIVGRFMSSFGFTAVSHRGIPAGLLYLDADVPWGERAAISERLGLKALQSGRRVIPPYSTSSPINPVLGTSTPRCSRPQK